MAETHLLYQKVVEITQDYLGPAADRFIARQIEHHLHVEPRDITRPQLVKLLDWIQIAMTSLTKDEVLVNQYIAELKQLTSKDKDRGRRNDNRLAGSPSA
jgi:hypothetical protein